MSLKLLEGSEEKKNTKPCMQEEKEVNPADSIRHTVD